MQFRIDGNWTLFLDRDGVINIEKIEDYIHHWGEFWFYPNAPRLIAAMSRMFRYTIVVTNQKGIGKGVTKESEVQVIHRKMQAAIEAEGGRIDAVFYCPATNDNDPCRKPNPGMAHQAVERFPDIDLSRSLMVGNNLSDMHFGRNAGMKTVFLRTTKPGLLLPPGLADGEAEDLGDLLNQLANGYAGLLK